MGTSTPSGRCVVFDMSSLKFMMCDDRSLVAVYTTSGVLLASVEVPEGPRTRSDVVLAGLDAVLAVEASDSNGSFRIGLYDPVTAMVGVGQLPTTRSFGPVRLSFLSGPVPAALSGDELAISTEAGTCQLPSQPQGFASARTAVSAHRSTAA